MLRIAIRGLDRLIRTKTPTLLNSAGLAARKAVERGQIGFRLKSVRK
jgi:hypothetical protein